MKGPVAALMVSLCIAFRLGRVRIGKGLCTAYWFDRGDGVPTIVMEREHIPATEVGMALNGLQHAVRLVDESAEGDQCLMGVGVVAGGGTLARRSDSELMHGDLRTHSKLIALYLQGGSGRDMPGVRAVFRLLRWRTSQVVTMVANSPVECDELALHRGDVAVSVAPSDSTE
ncbi:hypothetical protein [Mycolicibacterium houstonense]|uniref:hypothetical protein n=1 Tax=Mycolicibacterium houstonense TaxID=146021 RepID=UPI000B0F246B|nr:hypothetical protein [Mycolicibacterium houstonense]